MFMSALCFILLLKVASATAAAATNNELQAAANAAIDDAIAAAKNAEALRVRLQSHVEAQVKKILAENKNSAQGGQRNGNGDGNGNGGTKKLELKIDLPPDLAAMVNGAEGGAALKIQHFGYPREETDLEEVRIILGSSASQPASSAALSTAAQGGGLVGDGASSSSGVVNPCPLGTYSEADGVWKQNSPCQPCPAGTTTLRVGGRACRAVTDEDMLGMFYDLMNGDKWSEGQRRGWKSDALPACEWEGVSCDDDGEVIGVAFPIAGLNGEADSVYPHVWGR